MAEAPNRLPFFVVLMGIGAGAMIVPAAYALAHDQHAIARAFFYSALLFGLLTTLIALATSASQPAQAMRGYLVSLLSAFFVLPVMLAIPIGESVENIRFFEAWFEAVSAITTTGASLFDRPEDLPDTVHLWRAMLGWLGGLLVWVSAVAIFAPLNIGGFEVKATGGPEGRERSYAQIGRMPDPSDRLVRIGAKLIPLYGALTLLLWLGLQMAGAAPFEAALHAMSVLSTSGISPVGGLTQAGSGFWGEVFILMFFVFALSRGAFSFGLPGQGGKRFYHEHEFRLAVTLLAIIVLALFLRHGLVALEDGTNNDPRLALRALWGAIFTTASFLTTTGFESSDWGAMRDWSGLETPGLVLVGLALIGGGVATTAGGIKLLRVYALWKHGQRELERLIYPSSVGGAGGEARRIRRQGAQIAWIFFMLFVLSIAVVMVLLSLVGVQFETALVLSVSALSSTGPLADVAAEAPISYAGIPDFGKFVLASAMVVGRLEALALIALLNPEFWRR